MLYFVSTPIGNLKDMTYRGVEVLKEVDVIACEDTRHSLPLLSHYDIKKPLITYQKFNEAAQSSKIIDLLQEGKSVAVISDAGTPIVSDPGSVLVKEPDHRMGQRLMAVTSPMTTSAAIIPTFPSMREAAFSR